MSDTTSAPAGPPDRAAPGMSGVPTAACRSPLGTYAECPLCDGDLRPEHAHFRCSRCGWRDSCCD